jgi:hypothetical protein
MPSHTMAEELADLNDKLVANKITKTVHDQAVAALMGTTSNTATTPQLIEFMIKQMQQSQLEKIQSWRLQFAAHKQRHEELKRCNAKDLHQETYERLKAGDLPPLLSIIFSHIEEAQRVTEKADSDKVLTTLQALLLIRNPAELQAIWNWAVLENYGESALNRGGRMVEELSKHPQGILFCSTTSREKYEVLTNQLLHEWSEYSQTGIEGAGPGAKTAFSPTAFAKVKTNFQVGRQAKIHGAGSIPLIETADGWRANTTEVEQAFNKQQKEIDRLNKELAALKKKPGYNQPSNNEGFGRGRGDGRRGGGRGRGRGRGGAYGGEVEEIEVEANQVYPSRKDF